MSIQKFIINLDSNTEMKKDNYLPNQEDKIVKLIDKRLKNIPNSMDFLEEYEKFANHDTILIDAARGVGKSTIIKFLKGNDDLKEKDILILDVIDPNQFDTKTNIFTRIVSAFGTDWTIALLSLFIFGYLATIGYILSTEINVSHLVYSSLMVMGLMAIYFSVYTKKDSETYKLILISFAGFFFCMAFYFGWGNALEATNLVIKLINPTNLFKDDETFKNHELYGVIVRVITATILYQLLVAFRQNTRRT